MAFRIAFIGAGSIGFTRTLVRDLLTVPELRDIDIAFTDTSAKNLEMVSALVERDIRSSGLPTRLTATVDRREALRDAKYVFCVARIGGLEAFQTDIDIPLSYGVDQCVGDTLCAGGIMYGQRGIAALLDFCKDIREVSAPGCTLFNYANPMAMLTWAANQYGGVRTVGLCHGVEGGHWQIAQALGVPQSEVDIVCAGINHQTWYTSVKHKGRIVTSAELLAAFERHPELSKAEKVRIDMMRRFGLYSTESNGHLSEYVPWYRKRPDEIAGWIDLSSWINGETGGYLRVCTEGRNWFETEFPKWQSEAPNTFEPEKRSHERGSYIIEGLETGRSFRGHFNVRNDGCIPNLPDDAIVEVPGYVDRNGINITHNGPLPLGCAAVCNASISVQRLAVEAAVHGDDTLLRQAMMMDPLVGAVCNPPEIWQMVDEMLVAGEKWLPQYQKAIAEAKERLTKGPSLARRRGWKGSTRQPTKSIEQIRAEKERAV
jgi:alpha-galactosidase